MSFATSADFLFKPQTMDRTQRVLLKLKPKAKALGFNQKELQRAAATLAGNLNSDENASTEELDAEIDTLIDAALPFLSLGQSMSNRLVNELKKQQEIDEDDDEGDDDTAPAPKKTPKSTTKPAKANDDEAPAWAKAMMQKIEAQDKELAALRGEKLTDTRKSKLEALLKDTGTFGNRTLKSFNKMKFDSDEEFDEFISDVEADLKTLNQERANKGLDALGAPPAAQKGATKEEPYSEDILEAMAKRKTNN